MSVYPVCDRTSARPSSDLRCARDFQLERSLPVIRSSSSVSGSVIARISSADSSLSGGKSSTNLPPHDLPQRRTLAECD